MFEVYQYSLIGLWLILSTIIIQAMVAVRVHRRQKGGYMPGIVKTELDHSSIVFRTYRTCLLYTSPSPRDATLSRMPSSA